MDGLLRRLRQTPLAERSILEVIGSDTAVHPYLDIDIRGAEAGSVAMDRRVDAVLHYFGELMRDLGIEAVGATVFESDASRSGKASRHLTIHLPRNCFASTAVLKAAIRILNGRIVSAATAGEEAGMLATTVLQTGAARGRVSIVDAAPYGSTQELRLPYSVHLRQPETQLRPT